MDTPQQTPNAVDVAQASELTGLSQKALRRRLERGTLDSIKVGGRRLIPVSELVSHDLLQAPKPASDRPRPSGVTSQPQSSAVDRSPPRRREPARAPSAAPAQSISGQSPPRAAAVTKAEPPVPTSPPPREAGADSPPPPDSASPIERNAVPPTPPQPAAIRPPPAAAPGAAASGAGPPRPAAPGPVYAPGNVPAHEGYPYGTAYPEPGAWYYWYERPALRWLGALLLLAVIGLLVWLLAFRSNGGGTDTVRRGGGPVGVTQQDLIALSQQVHRPIYWAGTMPGMRMELTETDNSYAYIRYLTAGAPVGDSSPDFLTVGTYPQLHAYSDLRSYARNSRATTKPLEHGGVAVVIPGSPTSVYFAYPHESVQVEVYDPDRGRALDLVRSGAVRPVTASTPSSG